jgi:hypothetical protein
MWQNEKKGDKGSLENLEQFGRCVLIAGLNLNVGFEKSLKGKVM